MRNRLEAQEVMEAKSPLRLEMNAMPPVVAVEECFQQISVCVFIFDFGLDRRTLGDLTVLTSPDNHPQSWLPSSELGSGRGACRERYPTTVLPWDTS